jgi:hypothetical protein
VSQLLRPHEPVTYCPVPAIDIAVTGGETRAGGRAFAHRPSWLIGDAESQGSRTLLR